MKLSEYLPDVPVLAQQMTSLNNQIDMLQLMKAGGGPETASAPTIGLDHVVNTWVRHQMAYRQQLVQDLQTIVMSVQEIRSPLNHITSEVFRRGLVWEAKTENPDTEAKETLEKFMKNCNAFSQSLEEVLRQFHFDLNSIDDAFLYLAKEYYSDGKTLRSKVKEIRRLNPALVEFDLDQAGLPKNAHFICPLHREEVNEAPGACEEPDCQRELQPVMYKYYHRNQHVYLLEHEVIHVSKFSPSETYGWSPILTVFEKGLTLIGMDKNLYRYFFERKMPASMVMVTTDDPESLRREREHIAAQTKIDPNFIPMVAVSARSQRGRVDLVRLFHTLQEMDYLPVREEIRERIAAMWGVTPAWQGAPEAFGGLSTQTQQLVVMSRVVESDQRLIQQKIIPYILEAFGIDDWDLKMPNPEEKAEATKISFLQQRAQVMQTMAALGFMFTLKEEGVAMQDAEFVIHGEMVPNAQMQAEQQAMQLAQQEQQYQMQQQQQEMQQQQMEAAGGGGEGGGEELPAAPEGGGETAIQAMFKAEGKFNGRTGGRTPDWHDKAPNEERDIDEYAEARAHKAENRNGSIKDIGGGHPINKTWMGDLMQKGFTSPVIKEISPDGSKLWFLQNGIDFVADLGPSGVLDIAKATFSNARPERPTTTLDATPSVTDITEDI